MSSGVGSGVGSLAGSTPVRGSRLESPDADAEGSSDVVGVSASSVGALALGDESTGVASINGELVAVGIADGASSLALGIELVADAEGLGESVGSDPAEASQTGSVSGSGAAAAAAGLIGSADEAGAMPMSTHDEVRATTMAVSSRPHEDLDIRGCIEDTLGRAQRHRFPVFG